MDALGASADSLVLGVARSLSGRRWLWRPAEDRTSQAIAQRLELPELVGRLLAGRGVDADTARHFLDPTLRALLPDPSVLADMDVAAERLAAAVRDGQTVAVFGDYDVDGACSAALIAGLLRELGCAVLTHVPDRITEGYGPNGPALLALAGQGARLIVCTDCGTAGAAAFAALDGRADVLVLDHHKAEGPPPPVLATVNPNRLDDRSGLGGLCATGIAFLAAVALLRALRRAGHFASRPEPDLLRLLDLVALATVCDVMQLTGLNRALVAQGLKVLARRDRPGLAALLEAAQVKDRPSAMSCGFALGPRINAGGRIGDAQMGLRLLLCDDPVEARALAQALDGVNRTRQTVEAGILDEAMAQAAAQLDAGRAVLLIAGADWHPGVVGIVAGRIKEKFNRPVAVAAASEGVLRGSARSVPGLDIGAAVIAARQAGLLTSGGGHAMAAGFALPASGQARFHDFLCERLAAAASLPRATDLVIDGGVGVAGVTEALADQISRLAPFGNGNEEPLFVVPNARPVRVDRLGADGATLRCFVEGASADTRLKTMLFRAEDGPLARALTARPAAPLHLVGQIRAEEWNGTRGVALFLRDAAEAAPHG